VLVLLAVVVLLRRRGNRRRAAAVATATLAADPENGACIGAPRTLDDEGGPAH
jgi:hypothetical protein